MHYHKKRGRRMRSRLAIRNSTVNLINQIICIIMAMIVRKYVIRYLGVEILGVNAAIVEVVSMLALSELGIQYSISYRLYKPIAEGDHQKIGELFTLFKKAYRLVGTFILVGGIVCLPFVHVIVKTTIDMKIVYLVYVIQFVITAGSYFVTYYRTLLAAYQSQYFCTSVDIVFNIVFYALKLFVIVYTKNYIIYLLLQVGQMLGSNIIISVYSKRKLPFITQQFEPDQKDQKELISDLKEIVLGNISGYVYRSTDSMVISAFCGSLLVGLLANYKTITQSIRQLINIVDSSLNPTWGNFLSQEKNEGRIKEIYDMFNLLQFIICVVMLIPILCLADEFVTLWIGKDFLISPLFLWLIVADIYMNTVHEPNAMIMRGYGMFKEDKWISALAAAVNLVSSIILVQWIGITGVLSGTILALMIYWIGRSYVVNKKCFKSEKRFYIKYWIKNFLYAVVFIFLYFVADYVMNFVLLGNPVLQFILRGIVVEIVLGALVLVIFGKSKSMETAYNTILKSYIHKIRKRG